MAITLDEVRVRLDLDEIDYPALAAALGRDALPHLRTLAAGRNAMLASKAVYLAAVIGGADAAPVLETAAQRPEAAVRVAAAAAVRHLDVHLAEPVATRLLGDMDPGVRKAAVGSAAILRSPALDARVRAIAQGDPEPHIRQMATDAMKP